MIYTVTFNPALDYIMRVENLKFGETNRSNSEEILIGGKGINVSVILNRLGLRNTALGFIAGFTGEELERQAQEYGIKTDFVKLPKGNTRINVKLKSNLETEINANGPDIDSDSLNKFFSKFEKLQNGDTLVLSGSVPKCLPNGIYEQILNKISDRKIRVCVDATGDLLINTLKYKPFVIKPNLAELEELVGKKLNSLEEIVDAAKKLKSLGAQNVLVSMGSKGAVLLDSNGNVHIENAKKITPVNTVGAGDSMLAGFVFGAQNGYEYALEFANAAGGATAASLTLATKEEILSLL